ncbi:Helix-turn-helix domain protein [Pirellulimonas nuda]|uniref:Helix-turn-helix domain protein n=1 Tax=Pirellulimonas nuda TaxID=2528009 RepID=A0A518D6G3_9BACT|nr:helix-turn-helix domain-containing protein [Pirellulimonas nuda]QDU87074.1 Helix-turn-helix domain protein [Pirellulimonas nuda]
MAAVSSYRFQGKTRDSYLRCIQTFPLTAIASEEHLEAAQKVMDRLLAQEKLDRGQQAYLDALSDLTQTYEDAHCPIEPASDADMLRHLLDSRGASQADLHRGTGVSKSSISEVLAGKKPLSRQMIRKFAEFFGVDVSVLAGNL